jgi:hypothetical protein
MVNLDFVLVLFINKIFLPHKSIFYCQCANFHYLYTTNTNMCLYYAVNIWLFMKYTCLFNIPYSWMILWEISDGNYPAVEFKSTLIPKVLNLVGKAIFHLCATSQSQVSEAYFKLTWPLAIWVIMIFECGGSCFEEEIPNIDLFKTG